MHKKLVHYGALLLAAGVFAGAIWVLTRALGDITWSGLAESLRQIGPTDILLTIVSTAGAYLVLTVYDTTAFAYIGRPMRWRRVAYVSFISYAFSHSLGFGALTGGTVRYRFYSYWGVPPLQIAAVILFGGTAYVLALVSVAGGVILVSAENLMAASGLPRWAVVLGGGGAVAMGACYLAWSIARRPALWIRGTRFRPPSVRISGSQLGVAAVEWSLASAALYWLLPDDAAIDYWHFIGIYVIAYVSGMLSQVPGGLGVFEAIVILLLPGDMATEDIVAAIVLYRLFYYILPLLVGATLMAGSEVFMQRRRAFRMALDLGLRNRRHRRRD